MNGALHPRGRIGFVPMVRRGGATLRPSLLLALHTVVLLPGGASAQSETTIRMVRGLVIDEVTRLPVRGVRIELLGTSTQSLSDDRGVFSLRLGAEDPARIRFAGFGYVTRVVPIDVEEAARFLAIELTPDAVRLEGLDVVVDEFRHRFERRRNASTGLVRVLDTEDLLALGAREGFHAFWKVVRRARPCPTSGSDYCISLWGRDVPVSVCIDDRPAWAGVLELEGYRPEDFFIWEIYEHDTVLRAYTHDWVRTGMARRALPPVEWGC